MKGPSVGFHLKNRAETSSLKYPDYLNFSWVSICSFLSMSPKTGGLRYSLVCWRSLCIFCPVAFFYLRGYFSTFFSSAASYLQTVMPIFQPLYFFIPAFRRITLARVGCWTTTKYCGFLHHPGFSLMSPFFLPWPSSLTSILREPPANA